MSAELNRNVSPDVLDLAKMIQEMIDRAVRRAEAERAVSAPPEPSRNITRDEAARILGVKPRTIYAYVEQGALVAIRTGPKGGKLMFDRAKVEELANGPNIK